MLAKSNSMKRAQMESISLDQLIPSDHLVRKLEASLDFSFIYPLVKEKYSPDRGRPSVDPVVLIKLALIQYISGLPSMQKTVEEVNSNLAYRWFLGFGFYDKIPHFSTFSKNYERRFKGTGLFEQIFNQILQEAADQQLIEVMPDVKGSISTGSTVTGRKDSQKTVVNKFKFSNKPVKALVG